MTTWSTFMIACRSVPKLWSGNPPSCERRAMPIGSRRIVAAVAQATILALAFAWTGTAGEAQTLKAVKDRGTLSCGVSQGLLGFSSPDDKGTWSGFDVDFCRAIAAAIFNDPGKVVFVPLDAGERFA